MLVSLCCFIYSFGGLVNAPKHSTKTSVNCVVNGW